MFVFCVVLSEPATVAIVDENSLGKTNHKSAPPIIVLNISNG
jgi:hypothetical protein